MKNNPMAFETLVLSMCNPAALVYLSCTFFIVEMISNIKRFMRSIGLLQPMWPSSLYFATEGMHAAKSQILLL